jgi:hypothetical protein
MIWWTGKAWSFENKHSSSDSRGLMSSGKHKPWNPLFELFGIQCLWEKFISIAQSIVWTEFLPSADFSKFANFRRTCWNEENSQSPNTRMDYCTRHLVDYLYHKSEFFVYICESAPLVARPRRFDLSSNSAQNGINAFRCCQLIPITLENELRYSFRAFRTFSAHYHSRPSTGRHQPTKQDAGDNGCLHPFLLKVSFIQ